MAYDLPSIALVRRFISPLTRQCSGMGDPRLVTASAPAATVVAEQIVVLGRAAGYR